MIAMALAFSFGESIVFIGVLIPGSVVIILLGGLTASQSVFVFAGVMMSALVGSILGDLVSFFWGRRVDRSGKLPSKVYTPSLVEKGRRFFNSRGNYYLSGTFCRSGEGNGFIRSRYDAVSNREVHDL